MSKTNNHRNQQRLGARGGAGETVDMGGEGTGDGSSRPRYRRERAPAGLGAGWVGLALARVCMGSGGCGGERSSAGSLRSSGRERERRVFLFSFLGGGKVGGRACDTRGAEEAGQGVEGTLARHSAARRSSKLVANDPMTRHDIDPNTSRACARWSGAPSSGYHFWYETRHEFARAPTRGSGPALLETRRARSSRRCEQHGSQSRRYIGAASCGLL